MNKFLENNIFVLYGGGSDLSAIDNIVFSELKTGSNIYFSPSAKLIKDKQDDYFKFFCNYVKDFCDCEIKRLDLSKTISSEEITNLVDADLIYLGGGNTFFLNKLIKDSGFSKIFHNKISKKRIIAGYSAGAVVMGKNIEPVTYMDEKIEGESNLGLGIFPWGIFPHYNSNDKKQKEFIIKCANKNNLVIVAIPENSGLFCEKQQCRVLGKKAVEVFLPNGESTKFSKDSLILIKDKV